MTPIAALAFALAAFVIAPAMAADSPDPDAIEEAVAMVERVVALHEAEGPEALFAAINDPANLGFHDGDLVAFAFDMNGFAVVHGANPKLIGHDKSGVKEVNGKVLIADMRNLALCKGFGCYDYMWLNPTNKRITAKESCFLNVSDTLWLGVGISK